MTFEKVSFCHKKGIKIYPVVVNPMHNKGKRNPRVAICVDIKGKTQLSDETYAQNDVLYDKIYSMYEKIHDKINKK